MKLDEFLDHLEKVRKSGDGWVARCPGPNHKHGDRKSSLSVTEGEGGKILVHCFTACTTPEICKALGLSERDLFERSSNGNHQPKNGSAAPKPTPEQKKSSTFQGTEQIVDEMRAGLVKSKECQAYIEGRGISLTIAAELKWGFKPYWPFLNDQGNMIQKPALAIPHYSGGKLFGLKFRTIDGAKLFSQMPGSSTDGFYALAHVDPGVEDALILEGPEDAALAISHGFNAVAINAAGSRVLDNDIAVLRRHSRIFVAGDQDVAGQKAMTELQQRLPVEKVIRVRLPGFKDIGELYADDPVKFANRLTRILRIARASREYFEPDDLLTENEIQAGLDGIEPYVIDKLVPRNAISMIFGEEKGGKSTLSFYLGKSVVNGRAVFGKYAVTKCSVLYMDLENSDFDIKNFANLFAPVGSELVRYRNRATGCPDLTSPGFVRFCERFKPLVIFDSLTKFLKGTDPFHPGEMSDLFDKLLNLCAAGATVILIHHATRDDALRYANSHQIGASVARAFAVVSEDRPQLRRVRFECILSRGAEPITEHLIAFPVIAERGEFGLSTDADPYEADLDNLIEFVKSQPGQSCLRDAIKKRPGKRAQANLALLKIALDRRLLVENGKKISVPNSGTPDSPEVTSNDSGNFPFKDENEA